MPRHVLDGELPPPIHFVDGQNPNLVVDASGEPADALAVDRWGRWWEIVEDPPTEFAWVPLTGTVAESLELGDASTLDVGTTGGTVAAGDDPRFGGKVAGWLIAEGGAVISTGVKRLWCSAEHEGYVEGWRVMSDGAVTVEVRPLRCASGDFPPVSGDDMVGAGAPPALSGGDVLVGDSIDWDTTTFAWGDVFDIEVTANTDATWIVVELYGQFTYTAIPEA